MGIISVSGYIGSGKDTVGKIIQYLLCTVNPKPHHYPYTYQEFIDRGLGDSVAGWDIHRWADALKEMLCIVTGTKREQWEDANFKNTELGEEWWYWKLYLEGGYDPILLPYNTPKETLAIYEGLILIKPTPRLLLQQMGTECGRNIIHPNVWVNALMSKYKERKPSKGISFDYSHTECIDCKKRFAGYKRQFICNDCYDTHDWFPNWIITDTRFPNELKAVKDRGGISIRVNRYPTHIVKSESATHSHKVPFDITIPSHRQHYEGELLNQHESETALNNAVFDYTINNNGTIEELIEQVRVILIKEKILCPIS